MTYKIAAYGSAVNESLIVTKKAQKVGEQLSKYSVIVITGATFGIPYEVSLAAFNKGIDVWGFSPATDLRGQKKFFPGDKIKYKKLNFVPKDYEFFLDDIVLRKYRNVSSTATCDAGIIIAGRWGTMNEFTNLFDMGKVVGVLTGTGGIADELQALTKKINKKSKSKVIFNSSPQVLVDRVIGELKNANS